MWPTTALPPGASPSPHPFTVPEETIEPSEEEPHTLRSTISSNEHEVANGFVKNGGSLPYVYETTDNGNRKRSSKMIPICGICGKKFVCVTTMKRHLVTHTGEKPFSCKVCGKQYTQKGNLRVHERTHANHRPFECSICKQKFYRKEPMQKHQWRQHAIVHFKTRPTNPCSSAPLAIIGAEGVLYNSLLRGIKGSTNGGLGQNDGLYEEAAPPTGHQAVVQPTDVAEHTPLPLSEVPEPSAHAEVDNFSDNESLSNHSVSNAVTNYLNGNYDVEEDTDNLIDNPSESMAQLQLLKTSILVKPKEETIEEEKVEEEVQKPMKLKMKLAQAYMREVKEEREREERDSRERGGRDGVVTDIQGDDSSSGIGLHLSEIQLSTHSSLDRLQPAELKEEVIIKEEVVEGGYVECTCKSCGAKCLVSDPYNFRCSGCQVKFTSLPTHLIADPLQCIGCLESFAHKPALKAHQSSEDKERPFRCCRCVHNFRQKAHLQKHQWRIHRRKLEPDPNVKEAKAILQAVSDMATPPPSHPPEATLTIQQIIESSVERGLRRDEVDTARGPAKPLDLSPSKVCLDMAPAKMNSITAWLQQVETARTPIKPDISILRRPADTAAAEAEATTSQPPYITILSPLTPRHEDSGVTIKILEPKGIVWPTEPLPQQFAAKSRPMDTPSQSPWRRTERADNPLLNQRPELVAQVSLEVAPPTPSPTAAPTTSFKRARTEGDYNSALHSLPSYPTDLSKPHPLDLSSDHRLQPHHAPSPFDYSINRSELITGQLNRLKNLDNRSGI